MNTCPHCQLGKLQSRTVPYVQKHSSDRTVVDHIPAYVCDHCGSTTYDMHAFNSLQRLLLSQTHSMTPKPTAQA